MNYEVFVGLVNNVALLLALAVLYEVLIRERKWNERLVKAIEGGIIGGMGIALMLTPWQLIPGVFFDTRSVLLSIVGLFFGSTTTVISTIIIGGFRLYQGGAGAWTGLGVIVTSAGLGLIWRYWRIRWRTTYGWLELYLFGIVVHIAMLLWMLTLPWPVSLDVLQNISLPVMVIYPLGVLLLGKLLDYQETREELDQALLESETRYKSLFENNHAVMLIVDPDTGLIVDANPAACTYYGWTREELVGSPVNQINTLTTNEVLAEMDLARQQKRNHFLFKHRLADGLIRDVEVYSGPIRLQGRDLLYSIVHDISDRIRAERELIESGEKFREIFNNINDAIYLYPLTGQGQPGKFIEVNTVACNMLGYRREELLAMSVVDITVAKEVDNIIVGQRAAQTSFETRHITRDGKNIPVEVNAHKFTLAGQAVELIAARDITERKALQEQFYQSQKMESIGKLAGGIAHDFNNLLVPIVGYAELGMLGLSDDSKLYANLNRIKSAANRAADMTRQILAFSRQQVLEMKPLELNQVIVDFEKMLQRMIGEHIVLQTRLTPDLPHLQADKSQIEQVIMNLAVNARDAMPGGGILVIETAAVMLDEQYTARHTDVQPGPYVMLAVTDTGFGMDAATRQRIFEPFFTTKERGEGTGLGLATVFGIIKQHQGTISVFSEVGRGTTFKVYLSVIETTTPAAEAEQQVTSPLHGSETVLVVEDEASVRRLVCDTLRAYGYQVLEGDGPQKGLAMAAAYEAPIHLLLTDVVMPRMNGRELYQQLAAIRPDIMVLYMSGYTDDVIINQNLGDEVPFLHKPFTIVGLLEKVRDVLS